MSINEQGKENAISVQNVTKVYRLYDKPIDRLKESMSISHKIIIVISMPLRGCLSR